MSCGENTQKKFEESTLSNNCWHPLSMDPGPRQNFVTHNANAFLYLDFAFGTQNLLFLCRQRTRWVLKLGGPWVDPMDTKTVLRRGPGSVDSRGHNCFVIWDNNPMCPLPNQSDRPFHFFY